MYFKVDLYGTPYKCISGSRYNEKLTIYLTSSSTRSSTFIIQNYNLNCGFEGKYIDCLVIFGAVYTARRRRKFLRFCVKMVVQKQFGNGSESHESGWG